MEETNFVLLWKEHYQKIDKSLSINKRLLKELLTEKAQSAVRSLMRGKAFGIFAAVIYLVLLGLVLFFTIKNYHSAFNYFLFSIGAIFLINLKALCDYIRHLILLGKVDYDGSVLEIQRRLRQLQASLVKHCKIMVLQFPLWTTFFLSSTWFPGQAGVGYILIQIVLTGSFVWLAIWLYRKISLENLSNRWVSLFVSGVGGKSVLNALKFYGELEELEA